MFPSSQAHVPAVSQYQCPHYETLCGIFKWNSWGSTSQKQGILDKYWQMHLVKDADASDNDDAMGWLGWYISGVTW